MPSKLFFNDNGTLREAEILKVNDGGILRTVRDAFVNQNGTLRQIFSATRETIYETSRTTTFDTVIVTVIIATVNMPVKIF